MSRKILGIDIRSNVVAAVLATSSIKGIRIESQIAVPLSGEEENGITAETDTGRFAITGIGQCIGDIVRNRTGAADSADTPRFESDIGHDTKVCFPG